MMYGMYRAVAAEKIESLHSESMKKTANGNDVKNLNPSDTPLLCQNVNIIKSTSRPNEEKNVTRW